LQIQIENLVKLYGHHLIAIQDSCGYEVDKDLIFELFGEIDMKLVFEYIENKESPNLFKLERISKKVRAMKNPDKIIYKN
jgi:hypothetical protein